MKSTPIALAPPLVAKPVTFAAGTATLQGALDLPAGMTGLVVFPLVSSSLRHSPRYRRVAGALQKAGLGTLLVDLLTIDETRADAPHGVLPHDVPLLAGRLEAATRWFGSETGGFRNPVGYFATETGAAAALVAAARDPATVKAVVSAEGRPDLAGNALMQVAAPTLLLAGARDTALLELNREALETLPGGSHLEVFPDASSPLHEPRALPHLIEASSAWFGCHLQAA